MSEEAKRQKTTKSKLTNKERALAKALTKTNNVAEAGREAGYADRQAAHRGLQRVQRKMPEILDAYGLTDEWVVEQCLKPGMLAMETQFFANKGIVLDQKDTIAWGPRHQFLETWMKLKGLHVVSVEGLDSSGQPKSSGPSLSLVFTDKGAAREFVEAIAARRSAGGRIDLDAAVDANLGRARHNEPVQTTP